MRECKKNRTNEEITQDFWKRVDVKGPNECWEWQGDTRSEKSLYGRMRVRGKYEACHRFSLKLHLGELPEGTVVCHHCDNPKCVNPKHLYAGSFKSNFDDAISRNRINFQKGENRYNARLTIADIKFIRNNYGRKGIGGISGKDLAKQFSVAPGTISSILLRKKWTSVP